MTAPWGARGKDSPIPLLSLRSDGALGALGAAFMGGMVGKKLQFAVFVGVYAAWDHAAVLGACVERGRDDEIGGAAVRGERNVVQGGQADQPHHVILVTLHDQVVAEEHQHVDLPLGDHAADLEVPAERTAEKADDGGSLGAELFCKRLRDEAACGAGAEQMAVLQRACVVTYPIQQLLLPGVMCDQCDVCYHVRNILKIINVLSLHRLSGFSSPPGPLSQRPSVPSFSGS